MKTSKRFSVTRLSMVTALSLLTISGNLRALGPGAPGVATGGANGVNIGNVHAGAQSTGGVWSGGAAVGNGGRSFTANGSRSGVSFSNNTARPVTGSIPHGVAGALTSPAAVHHGLRVAPANISPILPSHPSVRPPGAPRVGNTWSGTPISPTRTNGRPTSPAIGYSSRSLYGGNGDATSRFTGQRLYRGAYGSGLANANANRFTHGSHNGQDSDRHHSHRHHGYYPYYINYGNSYPYFPGYLPYLGSYYGSYGSSYFDAGGYYGLSSSSTATYDNNNPDFTAPVAPGETDDGDQPSQQPRTETRQSTVPNNGPDSLVEAVQQELAKRGYFGGKIDAMYGTDTKEALRRFQTDRHLAASGLINEATLHALQLD